MEALGVSGGVDTLEHRLQVSDDPDRQLRCERTDRIAVDAVTGSSPRINPAAGITAATGSAEKRMMTNPITAFQNPATIQGKVTANSEKRGADQIRIRPAPTPARQAIAIPPW